MSSDPDRQTVTVSTFVDSTPLLGDRERLLARAERDGFLFFQSYLPRSDVLALRRDLLAVLDRFGWRQAGQDDLGGRIDLQAINRVPDEAMRLDIGVSSGAYEEAQKLESVHRLPHHPRLVTFYKNLFRQEVLVHPRHIVRMVTGHRSMVPTPPHQDFPLIQGTPKTWTCWIPLGDCPRELGGLSMLRGSHRHGYLPIQPASGAGLIATQLCPSESSNWVTGDYAAGDVITFPSYTVHGALPCQWKERIRLSLDVRYQSADEPVETQSMLPHCGLSWEDIYTEWERDDFKYYWRDLGLQRTPWNPNLLQPARRIC